MPLRVALVGPVAGHADEILAGLVTEDVTFETVPDPTDAERARDVLGRANAVVGEWPTMQVDAPNVTLVQRWGAGLDAFDPDELPSGSLVCNVFRHGRSIAEHTFTLVLALYKDLLKYDRDLRQGEWNRPRAPGGDVREVGGKTMGALGFGHIGQALVEPANGFGMDFQAVKGSEPDEPAPDGVSFLGGPDDREHLLETSDVVVVAVPLNDETRGMIGAHEFEVMRDDAVLVNVARGPIVDEEALYEALESKTIAGAGIDTWYHYPDVDEHCAPSSYPFDELDNVVMTPHVSGWSEGTARRRWSFVAENLDRVARGERPRNVVWEL
jgi:phosphoglycerate dehydrogenase-like enzyme